MSLTQVTLVPFCTDRFQKSGERPGRDAAPQTRRHPVRTILSALALAATLTTAGWAVAASAQIADVSGPGQSAPRPGPQCPQTLGCTYEERMRSERRPPSR